MPDTFSPDDTRWLSPRDLRGDTGPPAAQRVRLLDPGSLTAHLRARHGGDLRVRVLAEGRDTPTAGERRRMSLGPEPQYVRRVALSRAGADLVLARTLIPLSVLRGEGRRLLELGETPLGELVFTDFAATRGEFELARLAPPTALFPELDSPCWARRSALNLATGSILVTEAFLPGAWDVPRSRSSE